MRFLRSFIFGGAFAAAASLLSTSAVAQRPGYSLRQRLDIAGLGGRQSGLLQQLGDSGGLGPPAGGRDRLTSFAAVTEEGREIGEDGVRIYFAARVAHGSGRSR